MNLNSTLTDVNRRHDFVILFEVTDGNPNGDPDAGNLPRVDPETMQGLVTDVCIKRKVRDFVAVTAAGKPRMNIYVEHRGILNNQHKRAYDALGMKSTGSKQDAKTIDAANAWMCDTFYDIRTFGAVMTTGVNCGQVRGPVQLTFARSIDPVIPLEVAITRVAVTRPEDAVKASDDTEDGGKGKSSEMGRKAIVPYGLYLGHGFFSPSFAQKTGFDSEDLALFWTALIEMWDLDRSAARGAMACRALYVFTHDKPLGNAPAHVLFDLIKVSARDGVKPPRSFSDYAVSVDEEAVPTGVCLAQLA